MDILQHACEIGVDFVGFIMANESPRKISDNFLASLRNFNFHSTLPVFVFVNPSVEEVKGSGHSLMMEEPNKVLEYLKKLFDN